MLKKYLIVCYAILVKAGKWYLEEVEGETKPVVPSDYQLAVAEYLVDQTS